MTRQTVGYGLGAIATLGLFILTFVVPLTSRNGIIDTTRDQCPSLPAVTKHYHLLLGQLHDYRLVRSHLISAETRATNCGQPAHLGLYL